MSTALTSYIQSYFGVRQEDVTSIASFFTPVYLPRQAYFLQAGHPSDRLGFVQTGLIREYLHADDGREVTKWISAQGYFVVDLAGFLFDRPARWSLQALTDAEIWVISRSDYQQIGHLVPAWQELEKRFIARCFATLEDRIVTHLSLTAEERYAAFFQHQPALFNQVPLQYLASMLGMTPETFSRIRKKRALAGS
ncbi:MAG: Crp/Fnr family transcriptional regulator [Bacteroidia bacterium]|nr:Crp/Fnr family transcriptional regulator [Bacteroidia bacterium]